MSASLSIKRSILPLLLLCASLLGTHAASVAAAPKYRLSSSAASANRLTLSLAGAATFPGFSGDAAIGYEYAGSHLIVGFGVGGAVLYAQTKAEPFTHTFDRVSRGDNPYQYHYNYSHWRETNTLYGAHLPIYIGSMIGDHAYIVGGVQLTAYMAGTYATTTDLATTADYQSLPGTMQNNLPNYGYGIYPIAQYTNPRQALPLSTPLLYLSPMIEAGARLPLGGNWDSRLGLFVSYRIPVLTPEKTPIVDYSAVDISPTTQNQQNLSQNIRFGSLLMSENAAPSIVSNLFIGVRWTVRVNFNHKHPCMCSSY